MIFQKNKQKYLIFFSSFMKQSYIKKNEQLIILWIIAKFPVAKLLFETSSIFFSQF